MQYTYISFNSYSIFIFFQLCFNSNTINRLKLRCDLTVRHYVFHTLRKGLVENAGTRICGMRVCGYADMRVCGYAGMRICGYADMRVRRTGLTNRFQKLIKVAPYTLVQYLYRSVSNFRRPANVLKYSDHEKLFFEAFLRRNCQVFCS